MSRGEGDRRGRGKAYPEDVTFGFVLEEVDANEADVVGEEGGVAVDVVAVCWREKLRRQ